MWIPQELNYQLKTGHIPTTSVNNFVRIESFIHFGLNEKWTVNIKCFVVSDLRY